MRTYEFLNHSIIAHRGIYNNITIYENTLESIMYAVRNNLTVEIDIRLTKDNNIILFHDEDMRRFIKLKDKINSIELNDLNYISPFHVPTLEEVLKEVNGVVPIIIDIKEENNNIKDILLKKLENYNGNVAIQSFNYDIIKFFKKKKYITGLLISDKKNKKYLFKNLDFDFLSIKYDCIDKMKIKELKNKYYLIGWTITNRDDVNYYIKYYNNLIIDNIEEVFK